MNWLKSIAGSDLAYHILVGTILVLLFYVLSRTVRALLAFLARKIFAATKTALDDRIVAVILGNVTPLMVVTGFHIGVREVRKGVGEADVTADQILDYGEALLYIVLVLLVVKVIVGIIKEIIQWYLDRISEDDSSVLKVTLGPIAGKMVHLLLGMVALIVILDHFGISIGSLLVSLGVGSLAVALAAQDTLANMIGGFVILIDRPFRVGDRIELESGLVGDVQSIGLRSTKILNFDANLIIVPNAELVKSRIINHAFPFHQMRARVKFGVAYGTDPVKVRKILLGLADQHPDILKDPAPQVLFTAMLDSAIEFTLIARASEFSRRFAAEAAIREQAYMMFAQEGIEIPFPQRVLHMKPTS